VLLASRRENIGPHGVAMDEALDPDNQGLFRVDVVRDFAQAAINRTKAEYEAQYKHDDLGSLQFAAVLVDPE